MNLDLIDDDELDAIPDDDAGFAFASIERVCRRTMLEALRHEEEWRIAQDYRLDYMHDVLAAAQHYDIPILRDFKLPSANGYEQAHFEDFTRQVRFFAMQLRLNAKSQKSTHSVELSGSHKQRIQTLLHHLKLAVENSDLSDGRKASLHKRIRDFEVALEAKRLRFAEAMIFLGLLGAGLHEAGDAAEGAHKLVHEITLAIGTSKQEEDSKTKLNPRLAVVAPAYLPEPPVRQSKEDFSADLDDEIPF